MSKLQVRQGATLPLTVEIDDDAAETVTLIVKESVDDVVPTITVTASFIDGVADLTIDSSLTGVPIGTYFYQLTVIYSDDSVEKYPDPSQCEDGCGLPEFVVCSSLDPGVS